MTSMVPGVECEVENLEESLSQLMQEKNENKMSTKDILKDFGRRWSISNHVASLQAEKGVLERNIVGLEEKVQELQEILRNQGTSQGGVSTVVSDDSEAPATYRLSQDCGIMTPEKQFSPESEEHSFNAAVQKTGEITETTLRMDKTLLENCKKDNNGDYNESYGNDCNGGFNEYSNQRFNESSLSFNEDHIKLMAKLQEYKEIIDEFELIKEDWEGEKSALENVVVDLRQRLKGVPVVESTEEEGSGKSVEQRYLSNIQELLIKKNYLSEEDLTVDGETRKDALLSFVLKLLRSNTIIEGSIEGRENLEPPSNMCKVDESVIVKQSNDQCDSSMAEVEDDNIENEMVASGDSQQGSNTVMSQHAIKNNFETTQHECNKTENELDESKAKMNEFTDELKKTKVKNQTSIDLHESRVCAHSEKCRIDLEKSRSDLDESRVKLSETYKTVNDLETKLGILKSEFASSEVNFNTTISEKEREVHTLRNVIEQLQDTLSNFENNKAKAISEFQQKIVRLQNELGSATSSCEVISTQFESSKRELELVVDARDALELKLADINQEKEDLLGMVNDRDVRIEELQELCDSFDERFRLLQEEIMDKSKAFSELSEENSLLKEEKSDLFHLLETKENELSTSILESEKFSELLHEQEVASEEMRRQNSELAKDLENWRIQLEELNQTKEALNRDLDAKSEEILSLKESNIELSNENHENSAEVSQKLSLLEKLVAENLALKSENETFIVTLSENKIIEKELQDSYNLLVQEKECLKATIVQKSSQMEEECKIKVEEVEILRLEVARLTKELQEKGNTIPTQVSASLLNSSDNVVIAQQEHIRRVLVERDVEIDALRTKNESLLTIFAENEKEKSLVREEHDNQISSMLEGQERMMNEINEKNNQIIALEDRLEMLNIKSVSKDQASALIHSENQKLLHLNESQTEEIGRLHEKVTNLGLLVAERDHSCSSEVDKLRQRNKDLQVQVDALQGEQERLMMLVHDRDMHLLYNVQQSNSRGRTEELLDRNRAFVQTQLSEDKTNQFVNTLHELPSSTTEKSLANARLFKNADKVESNAVQEGLVARTEELVVDAPSLDIPSNDEIQRLVKENQVMTLEISSLRNNVSLLNEALETERISNTSLAQENLFINQHVNALEKSLTESGDRLKLLQAEKERLIHELSIKEGEILAEKEENNRRVYEIATLRNEKDELFSEHSSKVEELQNKFTSLLNVISGDTDLEAEPFEILENQENFERLVTRMKNDHLRLLSDKENEIQLLKKQVETLTSVQNISNPQLEAKLGQFMHEKDLMNQKLTEIENEKFEMLELKETEITSLQGQIVDLSNILKQKERQWSSERDTFVEKNSVLEKRAQILEQERESSNASKLRSQDEILRLRDELKSLTLSSDSKLDVMLHEKDTRVKDLEKELVSLQQRYSQRVQEARNMKTELDAAREISQQVEIKKEKELERLRTHLLQVRFNFVSS